MRLLIIRHGDPDYSIDSLTPKGWREAELLSERLAKEEIAKFYCSPLGRARDTASLTLKKMGREAEICGWLREFDAPVVMPNGERKGNCWDFMPSYWTGIDEFYDREKWLETELMRSGPAKEQYREVAAGMDGILAQFGYLREGKLYRTSRGSRETAALFCHFGVTAVLLSHLLGISPVPLWHGFVAAPTSVTVLYTEEREKGIASFRCQSFGDLSHLYAAGEPPAFAARFCETYDNFDERH
ncbi:MAG: histidine phosphatase family protein [Oscillospiraceae bacterium]|nr:histidine phosphatase family protein [Oscillospiraceae bacterium]